MEMLLEGLKKSELFADFPEEIVADCIQKPYGTATPNFPQSPPGWGCRPAAPRLWQSGHPV